MLFFWFAQGILAAIVVFNVLPFLEKFLDIPILWRRDKYHFVSDKKSHLGFRMCLKGRNGCFGRARQSSGHSLRKGILWNICWKEVYWNLYKSICNYFYTGRTDYCCCLPDPLRRKLSSCQLGPHSHVNSCAGFLIKRKTPDTMWFFLIIEVLLKSLEIWTVICDPCLQLLPGLGWSRCANKAFHVLPFLAFFFFVCNLQMLGLSWRSFYIFLLLMFSLSLVQRLFGL